MKPAGPLLDDPAKQIIIEKDDLVCSRTRQCCRFSIRCEIDECFVYCWRVHRGSHCVKCAIMGLLKTGARYRW